MLDADISRLALVHEVSPDTLPIKVGQEVASFFVLRVMLKTADNNEKNIGLIAGLQAKPDVSAGIRGPGAAGSVAWQALKVGLGAAG